MYVARTRIHPQDNQEIEQVEKFAYMRNIISKDGKSNKGICQFKRAFNKEKGDFLLQEIWMVAKEEYKLLIYGVTEEC